MMGHPVHTKHQTAHSVGLAPLVDVISDRLVINISDMFIRVCVCMLYGSVYFFALNVPTLQRLALSGLRAFSFFHC